MRENPRFREIYAEWSLIFECVSFLEACFLIPGVLKLTDRARCIKLQRCLFFFLEQNVLKEVQLNCLPLKKTLNQVIVQWSCKEIFVSFEVSILPLKPRFDGVRNSMSSILSPWLRLGSH